MANNKEHVTEKYVTPKGELVGFVALTKPSTTFNAKGVYSAGILLKKEDGEYLAEKMKAIRTEQFKKYGKGTKVAEVPCKPYEIVNKDTGEATIDPEGRYILNASASAYIEDGKVGRKLPLIDAKLQKITGNLSIGEGTIARFGMMLSGYSVAGKTGVSAKLQMVQIIKLVEYASSFSLDEFSVEDGGFEFEDDTAVTTEEVDGEEEELGF